MSGDDYKKIQQSIGNNRRGISNYGPEGDVEIRKATGIQSTIGSSGKLPSGNNNNYDLAFWLGDNLAHDRLQIFNFNISTSTNQSLLIYPPSSVSTTGALQPTKLYNLNIRLKNYSTISATTGDFLWITLVVNQHGYSVSSMTQPTTNTYSEVYKPEALIWWPTIADSIYRTSTGGNAFRQGRYLTNNIGKGGDKSAARSRILHTGDTLYLQSLLSSGSGVTICQGIVSFFISTDNV